MIGSFSFLSQPDVFLKYSIAALHLKNSEVTINFE